MSKHDVLADIFNSAHKKNYSTGKFDPVEIEESDESVVATYDVIDAIEANETVESDQDDINQPENEIVECMDPDDVDYLADEEEVKRNIKNIIDNGMDLLEDLCENVRDSEQPKSFEYAAIFMKTLVEMNEKMLDVHDRKKKRKTMGDKKGAIPNSNQQVNNTINIYESTPTNILKEIKGKKNNGS